MFYNSAAYIFVFADFKQHLPCLDSICQRAESTCHPTCRQYQPSVDKLTEIQRDTNVRHSSDANAVTKMVSDACQFIDCFNNCSRPLIVEKCGSGAANLQRDTVRKAFASVTNLLSSVDALPSSCHNLASPSSEDDSIQDRNATSTSRNTSVEKGTKATRKTGSVTDVRHRNFNEQTTESNLLLESEAILSLNSGAVAQLHVRYYFWLTVAVLHLVTRFL